MGVDPEKLIADPERSIDAGALALFQQGSRSWRLQMLKTLAQAMRFSLETPWKKLPAKAREVILHGSGEKELEFELKGKRSAYTWQGSWEGIVPMLERRHKESESQLVRNEIEKYMSIHVCPDCQGRRLKPEALAVTLGGESIDRLSGLSVESLRRVIGPFHTGSTSR